MHRTSEEALRAPDSIAQILHRNRIASEEREGAMAGIAILIILFIALGALIVICVEHRPGDLLVPLGITLIFAIAAVPIAYLTIAKFRYARAVREGRTQF